MGSAEGGEEVVESVLVGQVQYREREVGPVAVAMEQVVPAEREVEHMSRVDARRIPVVVLGAWSRNLDQRRSEASAWTT